MLLHIVRELYPSIPAVFVDTGLEYPEIRQFVKTFDNVEILRPKMRFDDVIKKYGYPLISKRISDYAQTARNNPDSYRGKMLSGELESLFCSNGKYKDIVSLDFKCSAQCCNVMKKSPIYQYCKKTGRVPITGQMAEESIQRQAQWLNSGCNAFDNKHPISNPMSFWTEQDVLQYIKDASLQIASVYGDIVAVDDVKNQYDSPLIDGLKLKTTGCRRTGCIFCAFGAHSRGDTRFLDLKRTHPNQYAYCIGGGEFVDGLWQPNKDGLGMGYVFDRLNEIYGTDFIRYK